MTDFSSASFPRPRDWQAFERHSRVLFEHILDDPNTQNNGRGGQTQNGVDIFGRRGGANGPMVGVQCKGKEAGYGRTVTEKELRDEVEKTKEFLPELKEFILITTASDDAKIQEVARLLQAEVRKAGRDLSIAVWGWETVYQRIIQYPQAIRAFHPDATPFTAEIINGQQEIKDLLQKGVGDLRETILQIIAPTIPQTQIAADNQPPQTTLDKHLHDQIDIYRDYIRADRPQTAIDLLGRLKDQVWATASERVRFRILGNLGAAHHRLRNYENAADFF